MAEESQEEQRRPRVLELRVHGVHSTPPPSMLGVPAGRVRQVAGDGLTGIYRTDDGSVPLRRLPEGVAVEAYSWGALTSGASGPLGWLRRVGWLFLLPFALLNLAYWARPELAVVPEGNDPSQVARDTRTARFSAALLRVAALLVTGFMVLTPLTIGVDLVAWQCYRREVSGCPVLPGWLDFMQTNAPRRVAAGALLALLVVLVLWLLSRQSLARYEEVEEPDSGPGSRQERLVLRHPKLWSGARRTRRLQRLHTTFALCLVISYTGIPVILEQGVAAWIGHSWFSALVLVDAVAVLLALAAVWRVCLTQPDDLEHPLPPGRTPETAGSGFAWLALGLVVVHLGILFFAPFREPFPDLTPLPGENLWFLGVFLALTAVDVMLFLNGRVTLVVTVLAGVGTVVFALMSSTYLASDERHLPFWPSGWPDWWPRWLPWVGVPLVVAGLVAVWVWHYGRFRTRPEARTRAWAGAGAAVLFGASVWVALLFTTSVVASSADYLNGPDQSVTDLGTTLPRSVNPELPIHQYVVEGSIALRNADVLITPQAVTVRTGVVRVGSFHVPATTGNEAVLLADRRLHGAQLLLAEGVGPVTFHDSCLRRIDPALGFPPPRARCSIQAGDRPTDGSLAALSPGQELIVGSRAKGVPVQSQTPPQAPLTLPQVLAWAPLAQLVWAVLAAVVVGACWTRLRSRCRAPVEATTVQDGGIAEQDRPMCGRARLRAAFSHRAERLVDWLGVLVSGVSIAVVVLSLTGESPSEVFGATGPWISFVADLSLWVAVATSAGLLLLASKLRKSEQARKTVGILWDLTTFWPRAVHPFAPPCYAERVVPELLTRVTWAITPASAGSRWGGADLVVLSGHSQGSTLVVAAASRLPSPWLSKVRLITYGSQLRAWYGRIFPSVFGPEAVGYLPTGGRLAYGDPFPDAPDDPPPSGPGDLEALLDRPAYERSLLRRLRVAGPPPYWVNLFRRSDPIGFRVFSDTDDYPDRYVQEVPTEQTGDPGPRLMTHSGYQHTPEYRQEVARWTGEVLPPPSNPPMYQPPFLPEP
jgi:hypothetical protein